MGSNRELLISEMIIRIVERISTHVPEKDPIGIEKAFYKISHKDEKIIKLLYNAMIHSEGCSVEDIYAVLRKYITPEQVAKVFNGSDGDRIKDEMSFGLFGIPAWLIKPFRAIFLKEITLPGMAIESYQGGNSNLENQTITKDSEDPSALSDEELEILINQPKGQVSVYRWLYWLRKSYGMTQEDLCNTWKSGKYTAFISAYEDGKIQLTDSNIRDLLRIFDQSEEDLYQATGKRLSATESQSFVHKNTSMQGVSPKSWLYELRKSLGKSQEVLAHELTQETGIPITQPMISLIERNLAELREEYREFLIRKYGEVEVCTKLVS
ncbi:MAG: helix-turn-helix transcriptional regulator [Verrucomicrobiota bacterium]